MLTGGLLPFPRTGCVLYAEVIVACCQQIRQLRPHGNQELRTTGVGKGGEAENRVEATKRRKERDG